MLLNPKKKTKLTKIFNKLGYLPNATNLNPASTVPPHKIKLCFNNLTNFRYNRTGAHLLLNSSSSAELIANYISKAIYRRRSVKSVFKFFKSTLDPLQSHVHRKYLTNPKIKKEHPRSTVSKEFGLKVRCSGRINGVEMARTQQQQMGRVPLQTIHSNIGYAMTRVYTMYGVIGLKVWVKKPFFYKRGIAPKSK